MNNLSIASAPVVAAQGSSDPIQDFNGLVSWLHEAGLIDARERSVALEKWSKRREAQQVYAGALLLRMRLAEIAERLASRRQVPKSGLDALFRAAQGAERTLVTVLIFAGLRPGEALGLRWDDITFARVSSRSAGTSRRWTDRSR